MLQTPFGLPALTYGMVAFLAGSLQDSALRAAWWIPVTTAAAASAIGVILYGVFGSVVVEDLGGTSHRQVAGAEAVLNAVLAAPAQRVVRRAKGACDSPRVSGVSW